MATRGQRAQRRMIRFMRRRRSEIGREMRQSVRRNCPVDTGHLKSTITSVGGDELFRVTDKVWLFNELGVNMPGNLLNIDWLSSAIRRTCYYNGIRWPRGTVLQ